jgi:glycerol-3-phosphate acyltransferase PlsY
LPRIAAWLAVVMVSGFVGLASIVAALALPVYLLMRDGAGMSVELAFASGGAPVPLFTHRGNVRRMRSGRAPRSRRLWPFGRGGA